MPEQAVISLVICEDVMVLCAEIIDFWDVVLCIFIDRHTYLRGASLPYYVVSRPRVTIFVFRDTNWLF
jgi:hypothetical protein